jgi:hypothetical protein
VHNHPENLKLPAAIRHQRHALADIETSDISPMLAPSYEFIEQAKARGEAVLVHCGAGVSRSATLAMAYLMRAQRVSAAKARAQVTALRSVVCVNDGFWRTLCALEAPLDLADRCAGGGVWWRRRVAAVWWRCGGGVGEVWSSSGRLLVSRQGRACRAAHQALHPSLLPPDRCRSDPTQGSGFRGHDAGADTGAAAVEALGQEVLGERV